MNGLTAKCPICGSVRIDPGKTPPLNTGGILSFGYLHGFPPHLLIIYFDERNRVRACSLHPLVISDDTEIRCFPKKITTQIRPENFPETIGKRSEPGVTSI